MSEPSFTDLRVAFARRAGIPRRRRSVMRMRKDLMWLEAIGPHQLGDDGIGEHFTHRRFALARRVAAFRYRHRALRVEDAAGFDDAGIGTERRLRFAGVRLVQPLAAGLPRAAMRAAMQRTEDHVIKGAPRSLREIDVLPTQQAAKRPMQHDPANR